MKKNAVGMINMLTHLGSCIGRPHIKGGLQVIAGGALIVGLTVGTLVTLCVTNVKK